MGAISSYTNKSIPEGTEELIVDDAGVTKNILTSAFLIRENLALNGNFAINQLVKSGTVVLAAGYYGHDGFKGGAAGCTYTFATVENITTLTISAGSLLQVIDGQNLQSGTHVLSWTGTCQGKIDAGIYGASGVTGTAIGGTNLNIEFGTGTLSKVKFEFGSIPTSFSFKKFAAELAECQVYYEKSYDYTVAPGSIVFAGQLAREEMWVQPWILMGCSFVVSKRLVPTIYIYSPITGVLNRVQSDTSFGDLIVASVQCGTNGISAIELSAISPTNGTMTNYFAHFVADARL